MKFSWAEKILVALMVVFAIITGISFSIQDIKTLLGGRTAIISSSLVAIKSNVALYVPPQKLSNPPAIIKAVYVTGYSAGSKKYLDYLNGLFKNTEINAVVVDVKGSDGYVSYASGADEVKKYKLTDYAISDIDSLVRFFHSQNIYVIGRIAVFEDPVYSKFRPDLAIYDEAKTAASPEQSRRILWQDNNGLSWMDPASEDVWSYDISLAKDAFYHGFDEVNFDYVRFPSDGKEGDMGFPVWDKNISMAEIIKSFFQYTRSQLQGQKISVDLFGQTTTNTDDMGIGQIIENAFENFDYVCPMVYPSHYINGFMGFANPADHPYEIINYAMSTALSRQENFNNLLMQNSEAADSVAKFRPWLQDFNMGAVYNADMVEQEIKATQDSLGNNFSGFMLWNPSNIYTKEAVLKPN